MMLLVLGLALLLERLTRLLHLLLVGNSPELIRRDQTFCHGHTPGSDPIVKALRRTDHPVNTPAGPKRSVEAWSDSGMTQINSSDGRLAH
jgi:hypothetical protein